MLCNFKIVTLLYQLKQQEFRSCVLEIWAERGLGRWKRTFETEANYWRAGGWEFSQQILQGLETNEFSRRVILGFSLYCCLIGQCYKPIPYHKRQENHWRPGQWWGDWQWENTMLIMDARAGSRGRRWAGCISSHPGVRWNSGMISSSIFHLEKKRKGS